jgi:hypothetical protein
MKRFAFWAVVPALVAVAAGVYLGRPLSPPPPMVNIAVTLTNGWNEGTHFLPAIPGFVQGGNSSAATGAKNLYTVHETYSVASSSPTHLFVLAHYKIEQHGTVREIDRTLPVYNHPPEANRWSKLGGDLMGYAYLSSSNCNY